MTSRSPSRSNITASSALIAVAASGSRPLGANDVFGGYDGGWDMDSLYIVMLTPASNGIVYRIRSRALMQRGVNYRMCPHCTVLCQEPG
jgi:hypothetical protein